MIAMRTTSAPQGNQVRLAEELAQRGSCERRYFPHATENRSLFGVVHKLDEFAIEARRVFPKRGMTHAFVERRFGTRDSRDEVFADPDTENSVFDSVDNE